jgi:hypothetical protein
MKPRSKVDEFLAKIKENNMTDLPPRETDKYFPIVYPEGHVVWYEKFPPARFPHHNFLSQTSVLLLWKFFRAHMSPGERIRIRELCGMCERVINCGEKVKPIMLGRCVNYFRHTPSATRAEEYGHTVMQFHGTGEADDTFWFFTRYWLNNPMVIAMNNDSEFGIESKEEMERELDEMSADEIVDEWLFRRVAVAGRSLPGYLRFTRSRS